MSAPIPITNFNVPDERIKYIEEQANKNLSCHLESKNLLAGEAKVTLNWLLALITFPAGYILAKTEALNWTVLVPLLLCILASSIFSFYLLMKALFTEDVYPEGNEPKSLMASQMMDMPIEELRLRECWNLQERIEVLKAQNDRRGNAVNLARWAIAVIPAATLLIALLCYLLNELSAC